MNVIKVCDFHNVKCEDELYSHLSNGKALYFCCIKGFLQSLTDYRESLRSENLKSNRKP